jgi:hypothetical protein
MPELEEALARVRAAWLGGGSAVAHCPPDWRAALGEGPAAEAALTALVGHAAQVMFRPAPPPGLAPRPRLPDLPGRHPPPGARSRLRRLLAGKPDEVRVRGLVHLVDARGFVMHPVDWIPGPKDDWAPLVYAPWAAWAASERVTPAPDEALTAETYPDWPWALRLAAVADLRRREQDAGAIVEARAPAEPAERRLKLVELLEARLGEADTAFLESLARDRSDRVRAEAQRLLARLGRGVGDGELARELAGMIELARTGLIRRRCQVKLKPLKTQAQEKRRRELLAAVPLADLARALGVAEAALFEAPPEGEALTIAALAGQVAATGSEAARLALLDACLAAGEAPHPVIQPLAEKLPAEERARRLAAVMALEPHVVFHTTSLFAGDVLGAAPLSALSGAPGYRRLTEALRDQAAGQDAVRAQADAQLKAALASLGLLLDAAGAQSLIQTCVAAGLSPADPRLDLLHLNVALIPERPK